MDVVADSVNVTTYFNLRLAADGTAATGLTIADLDLQYVRSGETPAAKVDAVALAATNTAHTDNRAIEIDATDQPGLYRVDWPDAAFAAGAREVILTVKHTTAFIEHLRVNLTPVPANVTHADSVAWNSGAITANTIATGAIDADAIADNAIDAGAIASNAITDAKIATGAITAAKFAAGAIDAAAIANGAIDAATFAADVDAEILSYLVDDATRIDASALNTATATSIPAILTATNTGVAPGASGGLLIAGSNAATTFATLTVSGATTLTGNVAMAAGLTITQSTTNGAGVSITGNGSGAGLALVSGATSGASAMTLAPGGISNHGLTITANSSRHAINLVASTGRTINSTNTHLGALSADSFNVIGDVLVSGATTLTGAVSLGSTLAVTGTTTLAAVSTSGTVTLNALTVSNATTLTGVVTATHASNDIRVNVFTVEGTDATTYFATLDDATLTAIDALPTNAELATALAAADDAVLAAIAALNNLSAAQVNAEVLDVLNVDTFAEIGQEAPAATQTIRKMIGYLYKMMRNKKDLNGTTGVRKLYADDGTTVDQKATDSDDGTTYTKGELGTGP